MGNKSYFTIDVFNYLEEDYENGERLYLNVSHLTDDILKSLKNDPTYKDYRVEVVGVKKWENA